MFFCARVHDPTRAGTAAATDMHLVQPYMRCDLRQPRHDTARASRHIMSEVKTFQAIDGEYRGPKCVVCFDVNLPPIGLSSSLVFESALPRFLTKPDDVWIASYPKSGEFVFGKIKLPCN